MSTERHLARVGAVAAIAGALTLFVATLLHPMDADPNDTPAAFAEYAAAPHWQRRAGDGAQIGPAAPTGARRPSKGGA